MSRPVDLRSDTVTRPTLAMRQAMADAAVGDDARNEDPTVSALEAMAAEAMGMEAAVFVPSGTMGNLIAHLVHCPGGATVLAPAPAHTSTSAIDGVARVAGNVIRQLPQVEGELDVQAFADAIAPSSAASSRAGLIWVEQPTRGFVVSLDELRDLRATATRFGVPIHMDGARIFNAATYLGVRAADVAAYADTVMFCLSKGLGAPVGSILAGSAAWIDRARNARTMLGGGMRQAGIMAAAGIYALEHHVARLVDDHANLSALHAGVTAIEGMVPDRAATQTNIFSASIRGGQRTVDRLVAELRSAGVLLSGRHPVRLVTHLDIDRPGVGQAIAQLRAAVPRAIEAGG